MKTISIGLCLATLLITSASFATAADKTVTFSDTPVVVQKTITAQVGDGKVDEINRTTQDGETVFEVDYAAKSGDDRDFTVAEDGTLLSLGVELTDTPAAVQKTIKAQLPGWDITGIDKNVADTDVSYDVEVSKADRTRSFNVDNSGALSSVDLTLEEAPASVQATIKAQIADGSVQSITENIDPDGNSFDVEALTSAGARKTFSVAPDGRMLSEGVALEQVPPAVRVTIMEQLGDGKILEIDKSLFEKKNGVLPYEVQGRKAGREFDFSVGPRGKFLGMD